MPFPASVEILVVGAGPSGLALASELARQEVPFLAIDRQAAGANTSRAAVIHARTLEVLEPLGVVPELLARGVQVPLFRVRDRDRSLMTVDFRQLPSRYAFTLMCPQCDTEAVLAAGLNGRGRHVARPCELIAARCDADSATVTLRDGDGEHTVRTRYLVGCDGMHSVVREQSGIGFAGGSYPEVFMLADVHMDWPLPADEVTLFFSADGPMVVAALPGQRFRVVATVKDAPAEPTVADIQAVLAERGPATAPARVHDIVWGSRFHIQHRIAQTLHQGPVLLAGDAAHVHSPAGGQGMNTGIQDAVSLGGALAVALRSGQADALRAWAEQRRAVASGVVRFTDRMTRAATLESRTAQAVRNGIVQMIGHLPAARQAIAMTLSELGVRDA